MRTDYHKLLTQAGRHKYRSLGRVKGVDDMPRESMRFSHRKQKFEFRDHLTPLLRMLKSKVGQSWNKVYSEIRQFCNMNSVQGIHVMEHVRGYVTQNAYLKDGKMVEDKRSSRYNDGELFDGALYVDDKGIIRQYRRKPYTRSVSDDGTKKVNGVTYYRTEYGWFSIIPVNSITYDNQKVLTYNEKKNIWVFTMADRVKDERFVRGPFKVEGG